MITLKDLKPSRGAKKSKKRVGRGPGSGHGKTACRGQKGQKSRSGGSVAPWFQGGQMPLYRQLAKRGFKNPFRKEYGVLNVGVLNELEFEGVFDLEAAKSRGLVKKRCRLFKVLGDGEITRPVHVRAHAVSATARQKIEAAGGTVEIVE